MRPLLATTTALLAILLLAACGSEGIQLSADDPDRRGAELFLERCSGCHSMKAAGAVGSANRKLPNQGPNLDEREVSADDALYAIRNGGISGVLMPQNIVVGDEAQAVAGFIAQHSGSEVTD